MGKQIVSRAAGVSAVEAEGWEARVRDPGDPTKGPTKYVISGIWETGRNLVVLD